MFYEVLAEYYDLIFPAEPGKVAFLVKEFRANNVRRVLDLACGTGTYTIELAQSGYEAWGTDLEPLMIEMAQKKAADLNVTARFSVGDMRDPGISGVEFDALFCIGNSLAHLRVDELPPALQRMRETLQSNGVAIFQVVNFDRILALGDTELPLIEREELRFERIYRPRDESSLIFESHLEIKGGDGGMYHNSVELTPICRQVLERMLLESGFKEVRTFGDFRYGEHNAEAQATVTVARTLC